MTTFYKYLCITLVLIGVAVEGRAQQDVMFSHYMFNGLAINPAYAGNHDALSMVALHREQWVGFGDQAPRTSTIALHGPMGNKRASLGGQIIQDNLGFFKRWTGVAAYAYRVKFKQAALSMGLQASFSHYSDDLSAARISRDPNDQQTVVASRASGFVPNFGLGVWYNTENFYLGVSSPRVFYNQFGEGGSIEVRQVPHYFVTSGYAWVLSPTVVMKPNMLLKIVQDAPLEFDANFNFLLQNTLWLGTSFRSSSLEGFWFDSIDLLAELQVSDNFRFGYAYEIPTNGLIRATSGSHELMINLRFNNRKREIITPRYF